MATSREPEERQETAPPAASQSRFGTFGVCYTLDHCGLDVECELYRSCIMMIQGMDDE